jgi:hypothetical protein
MKKFMASSFLTLSMMSFPAWATDVTGAVTEIIVGGGGVAYIVIAGYPAGGCSLNRRFVIDTNAKSGELMYAMALAVYHASGKMRIIGNDSCGWPSPGDSEGVTNTFTVR